MDEKSDHWDDQWTMDETGRDSRRGGDQINPRLIINANQRKNEHTDNSSGTTTATSSTPPAPMSGKVPSPISGIHTLSSDGINHTILDNTHQLRHRHQQHLGGNSNGNNAQQQQQQIVQSQSWDVYGRHSVDHADIAAGILLPLGVPLHHNHPPRVPNLHSSSLTNPRDETIAAQQRRVRAVSHGSSSSNEHYNYNSHGTNNMRAAPGSAPYPSFHNRTPITTRTTNNNMRVGSKTPESGRLQGSDTISTLFPQQRQHQQQRHYQRISSSDGGRNNNRNHDEMKRGSWFGGSEHDFLQLSAINDEQRSSSTASGSNSSYNQGCCSSSSNPQQQKYSYNNHQRGQHVLPVIPPMEITTNNSSPDTAAPDDGSIHAVNSYPPYGLPKERKTYPFSTNSSSSTPDPTTTTTITPPKQTFIVLGINLTNYTRQSQFLISAIGTFNFSLLYGYLQELISVTLCHRKLGLFLALMQFMGYTILSYWFKRLEGRGGVNSCAGLKKKCSSSPAANDTESFGRMVRRLSNQQPPPPSSSTASIATVPLELYIGLSILRAIDLGMTNMAMQYVNYPAKTLMKSTRVVFTMIFGVIVTKKRYGVADYSIVMLMVTGLGMFMHADAKSSAVFQPIGIIMLIISLLCDGAISNLSEALMNQYDVGQDEFIFRLYSIATFFIFIAAVMKGDFVDGMAYLTQPGTLQEMEEGMDPTWSVGGKILTMVLFSTTGFLGSSCSAAITKSFGALTMSITSTARKATTIFLSFALFPNECTVEHVSGIFLFIASLVAKSLRASKRGYHHHHNKKVENQAAAIETERLLHARRKSAENAV